MAPRLVCIGEAVVDLHADGRTSVGGAPLNVAVHAAALLGPGAVSLVTRVGDDAAGRTVRELLAERGVVTADVQVDPELPTGTVAVAGPPDRPSYHPASVAAWEHLAVDAATATLGAAEAVCWGGLLLTMDRVAAVLHRILAQVPARLRLLDPNPRTPQPDAATLRAGLAVATVLKTSAAELRWVAASATTEATTEAATVAALREAFGLDLVAVTRGRSGASLFTADLRRDAAPPPVPALAGADAVGAGDAWNAGLLAALLGGAPPDVALARANACGAAVAARPGGTPPLPDPLPA